MANERYSDDPALDEELRKMRRNAYGVQVVRDSEPVMDKLFEAMFGKKKKAIKDAEEAEARRKRLAGEE
jgi:hypothetical protein